MPKVSVCIPSYQLAPFIGEAIQSVLSQTFTDFELLIEDDGSTDNSVAVIRDFNDPRITLVVKEKNEGQNQTTNNLIRRAQGEYIALFAADDVWRPTKISEQVAYLDANPDCGAVFSNPEFIDERGIFLDRSRDVPNQARAEWQKVLKTGNALFISTSLIRNEFGLVDEKYHLLADLDLYQRIVKDWELHVIQEPLASIRLRDNQANLSATTPANLDRHADELEALREKNYPIDRSRKKIMFSTPFYENKGYSPYIRSMFQSVYTLARHTNIEFDYQDVSGGSYIDHNRNLMADMFMQSDCTHLFFLDSDQSWDVTGMLNVLKSDKEIVGAAYPVKNNWENYGVTIQCDEKTNIAIVDPADGLIKAQKVPTGFMKISRTVFEKLRAAMPDNWYWDGSRKIHNYFGRLLIDHLSYGEDISFGIRWQSIGGDIWVEPRVNMGHYGVQGWYGNYDIFLKRQPGGSMDPARKAA